MSWLLLLLYYIMLFGVPVSAVAFAFRSSQRRASTVLASSSLEKTTIHSNWKPILFLNKKEKDQPISKLHIIVLVHGWLGNPLEMGYLKQSLYQRVADNQDPDELTSTNLEVNPIAVARTCQKNQTAQAVVIHSAECNTGAILTSDGIEAGGKRVAGEMDALVAHYAKQCQNPDITLSLVGNSLGGLYARYAIAHAKCMSKKNEEQSSTSANKQSAQQPTVTPMFFVTTCTPHLGVSQNTFIKIPNWVETPIARVMQQTGLDLFRRSNVLEEMTLQSKYIEPLSAFSKRMALANVYGTDFQVPTPTAAFWGETNSIHKLVALEETQQNHNIVLLVETPQDNKPMSSLSDLRRPLSSDEMSMCLDRVGWTKILADVRQHLPLTGRLMNSDTPDDEKKRLLDKEEWTAKELLNEFDRGHFRHLPLAHTVVVANSKDRINIYLTQGGKATMDYLANEIIKGLVL